ncbi:MAG: 4Fe-4S dicluster domain-containing protein [candidate division WOR-3 bacterium]|nr:4Fe-4S dicluster domain-containing protein [candidate division WOR-3 bacterium]MCX7837350.1 4Fe-4S dicluster domain-containing protein [candidate division WOR-3 bacterium]MDW8113810.1 4Fe-4S dicluster domain-containing protein [candidate division WOR-3 bacterium]
MIFVIDEISLRNLFHQWLGNYKIFIPEIFDNQNIPQLTILNKEKLDKFSFSVFQNIRVREPLKAIISPPKEKVASFGNKEEVIEKKEFKNLIIGAKVCDLRPIAVLKKMYLKEDFIFEEFKESLENTLIISADCPYPQDTCFCNLVGLKPYVDKDIDGIFPDINLSFIDNKILIEVFTQKGEELLKDKIGIRKEEADKEILEKRKELREKAEFSLRKINEKELKDNIYEKVLEAKKDFWDRNLETCVECFGCLYVCPTCFCFLLSDYPVENYYERIKVWDTCYHPMYARVAGGLNPRAEFYKRGRNRFHCKFSNFYLDYNFYACSGCGRCFLVCMGKIDIRKILLSL